MIWVPSCSIFSLLFFLNKKKTICNLYKNMYELYNIDFILNSTSASAWYEYSKRKFSEKPIIDSTSIYTFNYFYNHRHHDQCELCCLIGNVSNNKSMIRRRRIQIIMKVICENIHKSFSWIMSKEYISCNIG